MSAPLPRTNPAPATSSSASASTDQCPVCKSSRYLNRNMKFMVNPECYHRMCESCVERLFHSGPRICPTAGCNKTLRRQRFRPQLFEDVRVEREVDIRRKVFKVFNRREEEFNTLGDYNNYLNEVEDMIFNLLNNIDIEQTEKKLRDYKAANRAAILENLSLAQHEFDSVREQEAIEHEQAHIRRQLALKELEDERRERDQNRQQVLSMLANGQTDAAAIVKKQEHQQQHAVLKRTSAKRSHVTANINGLRTAMSNGGNGIIDSATGDPAQSSSIMNFQGLKKKQKPAPEKLFDPFGGIRLQPLYYQHHRDYLWDYLDEARTEPLYVAAGLDLDEYYSRAMLDGFAGLSMIIVDPEPPKAELVKV